MDPQRRTATLTIRTPESAGPASIEEVLAAGADWWPVADVAGTRRRDPLASRQTSLRGVSGFFRTEGERKNLLGVDSVLFSNRDHWFVREVIGTMRRTFARIDVTSRSIYALVEARMILPAVCWNWRWRQTALTCSTTHNVPSRCPK